MYRLFTSGNADQKGKVMGIFRSLGALSRAIGPFVSCTGNCDCNCLIGCLIWFHEVITPPYFMQGITFTGSRSPFS